MPTNVRPPITLTPLATHTFELTGAYNLFETLRFGRMGPADPTVHLDGQTAQKSLWINGLPHRVAVNLAGQSVRVQQWGSVGLDETRLRCFLGLHQAPLSVDGHPTLKAFRKNILTST